MTDQRKRPWKSECVVDNNMQRYGSDHLYSKKMCTGEGETEAEATTSASFSEHQSSVLQCEHSYVASGKAQADTDIILTLKKKVKQLRQQLRMQRTAYNQLTTNLQRFMTPDQIRFLRLKTKSARTVRWSNKTVKSCLQLRYATGRKGYAYLRKLGYPVPAYRTLCHRVVNAEFRPGIQNDVFDWLRVKMSQQPESFKDCSVALDEMQLRPCVEYDKGMHLCKCNCNLFTARRYAKYGISCHRVSVRLSVTSRSCTKMAKPRIPLRQAYDSPGTLVFRCQKI